MLELILEYFIHAVDDVEIIDQDLRPKTMIFLGRKKEGDDLEMVMEEEALNANEGNNNFAKENFEDKHTVNHKCLLFRMQASRKKLLTLICW